MSAPNLLGCFLNKHVQVEIEGLIVEGCLTAYRTNSKETHEPNILVLDGKRILRGDFTSIKKKGEK